MDKQTQASFPQNEIALLRAQIASLVSDNERLACDNARLAQDATIAARRIGELEDALERLVEQIKLANTRYFGSKSEKVIPGQISLFNDMEAASDEKVEEPELEDAPSKPARPRRRGGPRRIDTSRLEHVVIEHTIEDPRCPVCGEELSEMKVEVRQIIRLVPAHLVVEEHRRHVYCCKKCAHENAQGKDVRAQIQRAPQGSLSPIPGSFASASLIAGVLNAKYALSLPLYRIEQDFASLGADISRQDMANWVMGVSKRWLLRIYARMKEKLLEGRYINADETEVQVLREPDRQAKQKSRMWLFRSGPHDIPICIYQYHPTRSGDVARAFLSGWQGYLTTDGYAPYFHLGIKGITNTACLVHIRRKFCEIIKSAGGDAQASHAGSVALQARKRIDKIFRLDATFDDMDADARKEARLKQLKPLMEEFKAWAEKEIVLAHPRLALHDALSYALTYWPYVENVLLDGNLALDNNIAERAIKPFVIGRKNWLFSDTPKGAEASACIYSIVITAKLCGLNQRSYLEWVLTEMPCDPHLDEPGRIDHYLPWSDDVPAHCKLSPDKAKKASKLEDEPIIDAKLLDALPKSS